MDYAGFAPHALIGIPLLENEDDSSNPAPLQDIAMLELSLCSTEEEDEQANILYTIPIMRSTDGVLSRYGWV